MNASEFKVVVKEDGTADYSSLVSAEDTLWYAGYYMKNTEVSGTDYETFTGQWENQQGGTISDNAYITWGVDGEGFMCHQTTEAKSGTDAFLLVKQAGSDPQNGDTITATVSGNSIDIASIPTNAQITIEIQGQWTSADLPVDFDGWTGTGFDDGDAYLKVTTTGASRHNNIHISESGGKANSYRISAVFNGIVVDGPDSYVWIDGIQIDAGMSSFGTGIGISSNSSGIHRISNCIIKGNQNLGGILNTGIGYVFASVLDSLEVYCWNNIVYDFGGTLNIGIAMSMTDMDSYLYNNTIFNNTYGFYAATGTYELINNNIFNNVDDFYDLTDATIDYCASDDGDGTNAIDISPGGVEADDWNDAMTDYANGDVSIKDTDSVLYNAGTDDPGNGLYDDDIGGDIRESPWCIGADEYIIFSSAERISLEVIPRTRDFTTLARNCSFETIERTRDFETIKRTRDLETVERTRDFTVIEE